MNSHQEPNNENSFDKISTENVINIEMVSRLLKTKEDYKKI